MNQPSLDELRSKYADRKALPQEVKKAALKTGKKIHNDVFVSLLVFSGVVIALGLLNSVDISATSNRNTTVLGESAESEVARIQRVESAQSSNSARKETEFERMIEEELEKLQEGQKEETESLAKEAVEIEEEAVQMVKIRDIEGGWVNYRNGPNGRVTGRVPSGGEYELISENGDWWEIKISTEETGWISDILVDKI